MSTKQIQDGGVVFVVTMKLNDRNLASFAVCSSPIDKEGYLSKRGSLNQSYQRRWFVLKGNLLFYFEKKRDREPVGVIVLEHCSVQASEHEKHALEISFDGAGTRTYILLADNDADMSAWIRVISHASYEYLKSIVEELQERLDALMSRKCSSGSVDQVGAGVKHLRVSSRKDEATTSQTVVNGHLMDIVEEDEPKPTPKIRHTVYCRSSESDEAPEIPEKKKRSRTSTDMEMLTTSVNLQHPHASPVEQPYPNYHQGSATMSPKSSYDPTACLMPEVCTLPMKSEPSLIDFDAPPVVPPRSFTPPASTEYQQKSLVELHEEFRVVMKSIKNEQS